MKKKTIIFASFFLFGLTFLCFNFFFGEKHLNKQESIDENINQGENEKNFLYVVKEYNGNVAIFEKNNKSPTKITDTRINDLPTGDKELLKVGIFASSSQELAYILEDYCS